MTRYRTTLTRDGFVYVDRFPVGAWARTPHGFELATLRGHHVVTFATQRELRAYATTHAVDQYGMTAPLKGSRP